MNNVYIRCVGGMGGKESVWGVAQLTPFADLDALVTRVFPRAVKAQKNWPSRTGKLSITKFNWKKNGSIN